MKRLLLVVSFLCASLSYADSPFPGLKSVLTVEEWKRAGLDRLSADELGVIDAALIRYQYRATSQLQAELTTAKETAAAATAASTTASDFGMVDKKSTLLERFGLPILSDVDWRSLPPLRAKVVSWETGNRFKLDNGQLWEGFQSIPYNLVGKEIEIQARPHGQFALVVEGKNTTLRVLRLR